MRECAEQCWTSHCQSCSAVVAESHMPTWLPGVKPCWDKNVWVSPAMLAEHICIGMQLLSSLLLLGGGAFLSAQGPPLLSACAVYVGEVVERGLLLMLPPMDLLLVAAPQQAAPLLQDFMQVCCPCLAAARGQGQCVVLAAAFCMSMSVRHTNRDVSRIILVVYSLEAVGVNANNGNKYGRTLMLCCLCIAAAGVAAAAAVPCSACCIWC